MTYALIVTRTRDGLRASCSCGADLGPSAEWESSVFRQYEHVAANHQSTTSESS